MVLQALLNDGMILSKAIPINELTGGPQPPILGASESSTPPELGASGRSIVRNHLIWNEKLWTPAVDSSF